MRQAYSSRSSIATAVEKAKPRTFVRGFRTYLSGIGDLLLALLLLAALTRLRLAALLLLATLTRLRLAALLLLTTLLLTRFLIWILIHSLYPLTRCFRCFATSIARFPWQESIHGQCIRSRIHIETMCLELAPACRVPFATGRANDGTLLASVVAWGADSDSGADLAFWWPSLDA